MNNPVQPGRIQVLAPEEARKIAAGEVIDRPAALVRELVDNAIDSGASSIEIFIEGGGITKIEVVDDGGGMEKGDLALCVKTHATSKIRSVDDLSTAATLGFRGEALAAAAAVARLEILSAAEDGEAWLLSAGPGLEPDIRAGRRRRGTSVRAYGLFDALPARKRFLKREGSEAALCRQVVVEKAMAFPGLAFRFFEDGRPKLQLLPLPPGPEAPAYAARFAELAVSPEERPFIHELYAFGNGFSAVIVFGGPELFRRDRRHQYVFANNRRIQDFSFLQALEFGLEGFFPNGTHPLGAVFINVDPSLADFNIHPAKREARFADPGAIHHAVTSALVNFTRLALRSAGFQEEAAFFQEGENPGGASGQAVFDFPNTLKLSEEALQPRPDIFLEEEFTYRSGSAFSGHASEAHSLYTADDFRFVGRAFGLFIIVEKGEKLFLVDQHAAHERIIYDRFLSKPVTKEELLVSIPFTTESSEDDEFLRSKTEELDRLGITLENDGGGFWRVEALPAGWKAGDGETVEEILALKTAGSNITGQWAAALSCKAAIKDGGFLDDASALELAVEALAAHEGRCPHGRPVWVELSRGDLLRAVRRTE